MCTLVLAHRCWETAPLLVAANRDEVVSRPSRAPELWSTGIVAPVDEQAGGTWLGHNAAGVVAAVTNRFSFSSDASRRSRGELIPHVLEALTAREAAQRLLPEAGLVFNPFNLLIADVETAWLVRSNGDEISVQALEPGLHIVTERSGLAQRSGREASLAKELATWSDTEPPREQELTALLGAHRHPAFDGHCVHLPGLDYATRSSSIIRMNAEGEVRWLFADGPPCRAAFSVVAPYG
jgi:uncharacterized protein with NRDE domain